MGGLSMKSEYTIDCVGSYRFLRITFCLQVYAKYFWSGLRAIEVGNALLVIGFGGIMATI